MIYLFCFVVFCASSLSSQIDVSLDFESQEILCDQSSALKSSVVDLAKKIARDASTINQISFVSRGGCYFFSIKSELSVLIETINLVTFSRGIVSALADILKAFSFLDDYKASLDLLYFYNNECNDAFLSDQPHSVLQAVLKLLLFEKSVCDKISNYIYKNKLSQDKLSLVLNSEYKSIRIFKNISNFSYLVAVEIFLQVNYLSYLNTCEPGSINEENATMVFDNLISRLPFFIDFKLFAEDKQILVERLLKFYI